jgi:hypothetical protein
MAPDVTSQPCCAIIAPVIILVLHYSTTIRQEKLSQVDSKEKIETVLPKAYFYDSNDSCFCNIS